MESRNPALTFSRASSKVGYLARDGVRDNLLHVAAALNEQKHALIAKRHGNPEAARKHTSECAQGLVSFMRGVRRELENPRERIATVGLTERIDRNLQNGQWARAEKDLGDLATRADQQVKLPRLDAYPRATWLQVETFERVDQLIERCNGNVRSVEHDRPRGAALPTPSGSAEHALPSRSIAPALAMPAREGRGLER